MQQIFACQFSSLPNTERQHHVHDEIYDILCVYIAIQVAINFNWDSVSFDVHYNRLMCTRPRQQIAENKKTTNAKKMYINISEVSMHFPFQSDEPDHHGNSFDFILSSRQCAQCTMYVYRIIIWQSKIDR